MLVAHAPQVTLMDPQEYDYLSTKFMEFFSARGFLNTPVQHRLSILAACEDPFTIATYNYAGAVWPKPQTGQMWLEYEQMTKPGASGFYCFTTSFREEPDPVPGRHDLIFQMFEVETRGTFEDLKRTLCELLEHLGFGDRHSFPILDYRTVAARYGVEELKAEHEERIYHDYGPACLLCRFPIHTSPFWNMETEGDVALKIDVILRGMESFGCAKRSNDPEVMRRNFHSVSNGGYAKTLFARFGRERVLAELDAFLALHFIDRWGFGSGMNRVIRAMKLEGIMPSFVDLSVARTLISVS